MLRQEGRRRVMSNENIMNMRDFLCMVSIINCFLVKSNSNLVILLSNPVKI